MSNEHELQKVRLEYEAWKKTYDHIRRALAGDPVAIAENWKEIERIRQRERDEP